MLCCMFFVSRVEYLTKLFVLSAIAVGFVPDPEDTFENPLCTY